MNRPLLAFAGLIAAGGTAVGVYVAVPGGGEEEVVQQVATATATLQPTTTVVLVPTLSPLPSLPAIPSDWATYSDQKLVDFTFRYPNTWYIEPDDGNRGSTRIASWDLATWTTSRYPAGGVLVDFGRFPLAQAEPRPTDATDSTLGGASGWEQTEVDAEEAGWDKAYSIAADHTTYRYVVFGYFAERDADESVFRQIVASFRFTD